MSTRTPTPSVGHGLAAALALSAVGATLLAILSPWTGYAAGLRAVIALLGLAYVLYTMARSGERVGRITAICCWAAIATATWFLTPPLTGYVLVHVGLVWLVRSLYHYAGVLPALADLALAVLGAAFAAWAAQHSGSGWLALWCFFLVQAFHVLIPPTLAARGAAAPHEVDDAFARAHRAAEAAVRRLS